MVTKAQKRSAKPSARSKSTGSAKSAAPAKKAASKSPPKAVNKAAPKPTPAPKKEAAPKKPAASAKPIPAKANPTPPEVKSPKKDTSKPASTSAPAASKTSASKTNGAKTAPPAVSKTTGKPAAPAGKFVPLPKIQKSPLETPSDIVIKPVYNPAKMPPFVKKQKERLIELRSVLSDLMEGMAKETLRARPEGSDASVGGMHMGDAGSDAYDRDFALSMLTKEQDALYEINEALDRLDRGVYGMCELSGKKIPDERLEALPYTRYTREMQEQIERDQMGGRFRRPIVRSVFGLDEDAEGDEDDEEGETKESSPTESSLDFMKE